MNMALSADGKISTRKRERITLGTKNDRCLMDILRAGVDGVVIGAGTLKYDGYPLLVRNAEIRRSRIKKGFSPHPINILLSRGLKIPISKEFFKHNETEKIVFTTRAADNNQRKRLEKYAEVVVLPSRESFLKGIMRNLSMRGLKKVLVEGGGEVNYAFFKERFVDEIYLTVTPYIIGGSGTPTVVDGMGFLKNSIVELELRSAKRVGPELFLRYRVKKTRA